MQEQMNESIGNLKDKVLSWMDLIILNIPNIILALIIFSAAYFASRELNILTNKLLKSKVKKVSVRNLVGNIASISVVLIGLFIALSILNLDTMISSILAGAGVAGLAVGLALQGALSNTFSGIFLSIKEILNVGDYIETNGFAGTVDEINLRHIKLREADNNFVFIPNKLVVEKPFKNYGLTPLIRTTINCGVGYESDLEMVKQISIETIESHFPQDDKAIEFHYLSFGESSINFQLRFWVPAIMQMNLLEAKSTAIMLIKKRFDQENINIPYPIRTLYSTSQN